MPFELCDFRVLDGEFGPQKRRSAVVQGAPDLLLLALRDTTGPTTACRAHTHMQISINPPPVSSRWEAAKR